MMFTRNEWLGLIGVLVGILSIFYTVFISPLLDSGIDISSGSFSREIIYNSGIMFVFGMCVALGLVALISRKKFILGKPTVLTPLKASIHEIELWTDKANEHFDVDQLQISTDRYRQLYAKSPSSFRIFKSRATGKVVGGYVFLFLRNDVSQKLLRGEYFMGDLTDDMICSPIEADTIHVCDIVSDRADKTLNNVIMFDVFSQLIGTVRALDNINNLTAHSIDKFYESLLEQMGFSHKPIRSVERTGRKLWVANSDTLRSISWTANQYL